MKRSSRTGWLRLGILVSVIWFLGVAFYAAYEWDSERIQFTSAALMSESKGEWAVVGQESFWVSCHLVEKKTSCSSKVLNILGVEVVPLIAMWCLAFAVAWVRAGFRSNET
jgi:disulfide bond formation protein DsbB